MTQTQTLTAETLLPKGPVDLFGFDHETGPLNQSLPADTLSPGETLLDTSDAGWLTRLLSL